MLRVLLLCLGMAVDCLADDVVVRTRLGALRGRRVSAGHSGYVDTFLGIPYALPPVGSLRFQKPRQAQAWPGTRDATSFGPACPQLPPPPPCSTLVAEEDCLSLNVYSPKTDEKTPLLPVMVWIHGGGYRSGSGARYSGTTLASRGVVVVTLNYRMDALGFLSTQDDACPGNFGLLDQIMALQWVKDNIKSFHGNPNQITIFGSSAGGASVSLLRLSPLAKDLFTTTVIQSGVSLSPWAVGHPLDPVSPARWARSLGHHVGCANHSNPALLACLRGVSATALLNASAVLLKEYSGKRDDQIIFKPVVETIIGVLPELPAVLLRNSRTNDIVSVRGFTRDEYSSFMLDSSLVDFSRQRIEDFIAKLARRTFPRDPDVAASAIISRYMSRPHVTSAEQLREAEVKTLTDFYIVAPTIIETQTAMDSSGEGKVYLYEFSYRATNYGVPFWAGIPHGSDLPFLFGEPLRLEAQQCGARFNWTASDVLVSNNIMTLWTNIAKFGNPTPTPLNGTTWTSYDLARQEYAEISTFLAVKARLKEDLIQFWTDLFYRHGYLDNRTFARNSADQTSLHYVPAVFSGSCVSALLLTYFSTHAFSIL